MDDPTRDLVRLLRERDALRRKLRDNDAQLTPALSAWTASRPGHLRGKTTEAGARYLLGQAGLL